MLVIASFLTIAETETDSRRQQENKTNKDSGTTSRTDQRHGTGCVEPRETSYPGMPSNHDVLQYPYRNHVQVKSTRIT